MSQYNGFIINKGADFIPGAITWKDADGVAINLTGYTARMQIKRDVSTASILELTTENSRITLGGSAGTIELNVTNAVTATLPAGNYKYDMELISSGGIVTRLLEGSIVISENITT